MQRGNQRLDHKRPAQRRCLQKVAHPRRMLGALALDGRGLLVVVLGDGALGEGVDMAASVRCATSPAPRDTGAASAVSPEATGCSAKRMKRVITAELTKRLALSMCVHSVPV